MITQLSHLKEKLSPIANLIKDKEDVFYLDYPLHLNIGDLLIYHGTEQFFKDYKINIRLRRSCYDIDLSEMEQKITPNTTILCHGGGNFGDLYPELQTLREDIIKKFPNNRIIVLPQTLYYKNKEHLTKSASIFIQHKDCHLFARDKQTLEDFKKFSSNTYLSPDMAHQLYGYLPIKNLIKNTTSHTLFLSRTDIEKNPEEKDSINNISSNSKTCDWDGFLSYFDNVTLALTWRTANFAKKYKLNWLKNITSIFWLTYTKTLIQKITREFICYDHITSSRLHGHILSCLLEIPNTVLDNSYGKNTRYTELWTKDISFK